MLHPCGGPQMMYTHPHSTNQHSLGLAACIQVTASYKMLLPGTHAQLRE